jgi:sec-independent protein translocase protein TatC
MSDSTMGFLEHLDELRTRIIRSCIAIGVGMVVAFTFLDRLVDIILDPILKTLPPGSSLVFIRPGEGFSFHLNVAFVSGLILAAPYVMYQVWRFVAPGLYANEKRLMAPFVALTTAGSACGALFCHFVMFPAMMSFFGGFNSTRMRFMPGVEDTVDLYVQMMLGMVVVFQIPALVYFLARMRLVTARFLWRHFQYAILIIFTVAAVLTPSTDPWNQTVFAIPMVGLYLLGIVVAWIVGPKGEPEWSANVGPGVKRLFIAALLLPRKVRGTRSASLA